MEKIAKKTRDLIKFGKIKIIAHAHGDRIKHNYSERLIYEAFEKGQIFEDIELYGKKAESKHKGKNYYCVYFYKVGILYSRGINISYKLKNKVIVIHMSPTGGIERKKYKERLKYLALKK